MQRLTEGNTIFKEQEVMFSVIYEYCSFSDRLSETEEMIRRNSLAFKDVYRRKLSLLTSEEIKAIRRAYGLNKKNFSAFLG